MMPEMTGHGPATPSSSSLAPDQAERIVFVTGGAFTPRAREFLERVPNARVEKPIDFQNLRLLAPQPPSLIGRHVPYHHRRC